MLPPLELLRDLSNEFGFSGVGVTSFDSLDKDFNNYKNWIDSGYHASMDYLERGLEKRANLESVFPECKSVLIFSSNYNPIVSEKSDVPRSARYSVWPDYHKVIPKKIKQLMKKFSENLGTEIKYKVVVDTAPVLERAIAVKSGIGFIGKNTNCISPQYGSWFFLAEVGVNISLPSTSSIQRDCGDCNLCIEHCPTGALVEPYKLDAGKCLSYLTIEYKGFIPEKYYSLMGNRIFGCDKCQEICPYNKKDSIKTFLGELPLIPDAVISLNDIWECDTDEKFRNRFQNSPIKRAGRMGLWRNAAIVAGNINHIESIPILKRILNNESDEGLCSASAWALKNMS